MASSEDKNKSLSALFQEGLDLFNNLGKIDEPTNSPNVQINIKKAMHILEDSTRLVSMASIFSSNERIDEVPTEHIQYFLLPALLGTLSLKLTSGDRKDIINTAEVYFKDFLSRCNNYGLSNYKFKEECQDLQANRSEFQDIAHSVNTRSTKIQRFKEQKVLKENLEDLKKNMNNESVDDEIKRNYFLTMIKLYIYEAIDELNCIDMEKPILEHMEKMGNEKPKPKIPVKPLRPIIITKDEMQKAVFGAGYPSLPSFTVQEFYDQRIADGVFPNPTKPKQGPMSMQEAALAGIDLNADEREAMEKEQLEEADDPENIARMRAKDEFKDEHRRGWGNRMNRS
ncbi:PREDICTED: immunoglobulin-binding protein 1b [Nicrophorus vespilloides]|uniref:Immunoglobulin-binding protein 1b n=1 Tax=Nicrophorus vespilloides TaxID=110193 RepID=A0ABM1MR06_NICVS|nr:PREDICTED: immunoglobulin-binding protein 1b [Nicrophorus vespilloides]